MVWKFLVIISILYFLHITSGQNAGKRLVCYYDIDSSLKSGRDKFSERYLDNALVHCTHLVYASATLNPKTFDVQNPIQNASLSDIKRRYPHLRIYLSVGGVKDYDNQDPIKYLRFLESNRAKQHRFINSSLEILTNFGFHGLDLAFALPRNKPRDGNSVELFFNDMSKMFTSQTQTEVYKNHYTRFLGDLKQAYSAAKLSLTMTVLPNVNSTWFFDVDRIDDNFEFINLFAFDFNTPERSPKEADYTSPLRYNSEQNRLVYANIEFQVDYWLKNNCPANKLNLGIATYGRAWAMSVQSGLSGQPVIEETRGPAHVMRTKQNAGGLISWTDICFHMPPHRHGRVRLRKVSDSYGTYAFRPADANNTNGYWVSFDEPEFAATKAKYAKDKQLGGVALYDLSNDDFRGRCMRQEYPMLQSIQKALDIRNFEATKTYASIARAA